MLIFVCVSRTYRLHRRLEPQPLDYELEQQEMDLSERMDLPSELTPRPRQPVSDASGVVGRGSSASHVPVLVPLPLPLDGDEDANTHGLEEMHVLPTNNNSNSSGTCTSGTSRQEHDGISLNDAHTNVNANTPD
jgi:hypothetical protein